MVRKKKIGVITLGCSKNTVDSERLMKQLAANNFDVVQNADKVDTVIINTCGFIDAAKEESVNSILNAVELKKLGKIKKVVVAGCLSERYKSDLELEIPEVDKYFGTEKFEGILEEVGGELKYELLGERMVSTPSHFAYLKISEGCDHPCSFCAIPIMRGKHRSKSIDDLVREAEFLAANNTKELILIGQDTTEYGIDIFGKRSISLLLERLSRINGIEWIRLLYAYPSRFPEDLLDIMAGNEKVLKYIDIPLQHISDNVLKSMRRGITKKRTIELIQKIKEKIPGVALRTTFIVGYPNENKKEYNELCDFVREMEFDRVGVFTYSSEENTSASILGDPVSKKVKEERKSILMDIQKEISINKNSTFVGSELKVLVDGFEGNSTDGFYTARSYRDAPEVDGEILIPAKYNCSIGRFYYAGIYDYNEYDLFGSILYGANNSKLELNVKGIQK